MGVGMSSDKEKTQIILNTLNAYYNHGSRQRRFVKFPELRLGSGYSNNSQRRVDYFVIDSNAGNVVTGYEIKASRQDFLKDIKDPFKQRGARQYCNEFYYICLEDLIKREEVPLWTGLIQLQKDEYGPYNGYQFHIAVPSPYYEKTTPTWSLICAMIRKFEKLKEQQ